MDRWDTYSKELKTLKFSDYRYDYLLKDMQYDGDLFNNKLLSTHSDNLRDKA